MPDFKGMMGGSSETTGVLGGGMMESAGAASMGIDSTMCPSLSLKHRFMGFGICFCIGMILSFLSTISLSTGNITQFAVIYSFGNIVAMCRCVRPAPRTRQRPPGSACAQ